MSLLVESARQYGLFFFSRNMFQKALSFIFPLFILILTVGYFYQLDFSRIPSNKKVSPDFTHSSKSESEVLTEEDYTLLSDQAWFGAPMTVTPEKVEEVAQETTLNLELKATIAGGQSPRAIILDVSKGTSQMFKLEEDVLNGVKLLAIERRHVLLDNKGKKEALNLPISSLDVSQEDLVTGENIVAPKQKTATKHKYIPLALRKIDLHQKVTISKLDAVEALGNLGALSKKARMIPRVSKDYGIVGYQFMRMDHDSLFRKVSLKEGDTIVRVNGVEVKNKEKVFPVLMSLAKSEKANLVIYRGGQMISLDIYLK